MNQTFFVHDADDARATRDPRRSGRPEVARHTLWTARVPMLDWAADVFSDGATAGELMAEEFALPFDPSALFRGQEFYSRAA